MPCRSLIQLPIVGALLALSPAPVLAGDIDTCLDTADQAKAQGPLAEDVKRAAHEACQRALADSSNVVNKYLLQEADFDIMGRPH
jgi:hypothetical protein